MRLQPQQSLAALALFVLPAVSDAGDYSVEIDADLRSLRVEACFRAPAPARLRVPDPEGPTILRRLRHPDGTPLTIHGTSADLHPAREPCVKYEIDLTGIEPAPRGSLSGWRSARVENDLIVAPARWLLRPEDQRALRVRFLLPPGMSVSLPWQPVEGAAVPTYSIAETPIDWSSTAAFGRFQSRTLAIGAAQLHVAVLGAGLGYDEVSSWLEPAARSVAALYGRFPLAHAQVMIVPVGGGGEPVPFAHVLRGGGTGLRFFVDPTYPLERFRADWTATHEFSHLLHPVMRDRDLWLAEGLASYYQNVLRARNQTHTPIAAWRKLHLGFTRGRAEVTAEALESVAEDMRRNHRFMRVYWTGAAVALLGDLALRQASNGRESLDTALDRFQRCCLEAPREWSAEQFMAALDRLTGHNVFMPLHRAHARSSRFPDIRATFDALGIDPAGTDVVLRDDAPAAVHRRAIMCGSADCPDG